MAQTHAAPLPATAVDLMARADAELLAAQFSTQAGERFVHAHLAGLRAAAAIVAARGRPAGRTPRTVWEMLAVAAPEVETWSVYFAGGAALRRAVEAGRSDVVDVARAEQAACAAQDFIDEVRALLDVSRVGTPGGARRLLAVRAS